MSNFSNLKEKLMSQGKSEKSAGSIAYSIGKKKYGAPVMAKAAAMGKPADTVKVFKIKGINS